MSRLSIEKEKVEKFQKEMENIVAMCEKLPPMDGDYTSVDPSNTMELSQDEFLRSLKRDQLLQNAPQTLAVCFVVPIVVD